MGLAKTIGDDMGHPGIGSNKTPTIRSLRNIIHATPIPIKLKALTETGVVTPKIGFGYVTWNIQYIIN
jgi:hypothetical protein